MREIKFRGLRVDGNGWVYGYYWMINEHFTSTLSGIDYIKSINNGVDYTVIPETVSQFTGLKDKDGVDIYEGDLLSNRYEDEGEEYETLLPIVWCSKNLQWCVDGSFVRDSSYLVSVVNYFGSRRLEIKGNVHDKGGE